MGNVSPDPPVARHQQGVQGGGGGKAFGKEGERRWFLRNQNGVGFWHSIRGARDSVRNKEASAVRHCATESSTVISSGKKILRAKMGGSQSCKPLWTQLLSLAISMQTESNRFSV